MKILSYLNISNIDNISCDSGYVFNYAISRALKKRGVDFKIILPIELVGKNKKFDEEDCYYAQMGCTRYEVRYRFDWKSICDIIRGEQPDIIFVNQPELVATFKALLLENDFNHIKIFAYCHYVALHVDTENNPIIDYTLNNSMLGENIIYNILTAINISDFFAIQSQFASNLLINYARIHNFKINKRVYILHPPLDEDLLTGDFVFKTGKYILYNHRLYESYGTSFFVDFVDYHVEYNFIVANPMCNRSSARRKFNSSPEKYNTILAGKSNVKLINGGERCAYRDAIDMCRCAIVPYRTACVWSMSIADCYCRYVPVVAPKIGFYEEFVPSDLLFCTKQEESEIINELLVNDDFWLKSVKQCREFLQKIVPETIIDNFLNIVNKK